MSESEPSQSFRSTMDDEISLWEVLAVLVRRRGTIALTTFLVGASAAAHAQFRPMTYTTSAAFRPQGSEVSNSQVSWNAAVRSIPFVGGSSS